MRALLIVLLMSGSAWAQVRAEDADCNNMDGQAVIYRRAAKNNPTRPDLQKRADDWDAAIVKCRADAAARVAKQATDRAARLEAQRLAAEEAAHAEERAAQIQADPQGQRVAWSALLCGWKTNYDEAVKELAERKRASKLGGVVELREVNTWQNETIKGRRFMTRATAELKKLKAKPIACTDPLVSQIAPCMTDDVQEAGSCGPDVNAYYGIARGE